MTNDAPRAYVRHEHLAFNAERMAIAPMGAFSPHFAVKEFACHGTGGESDRCKSCNGRALAVPHLIEALERLRHLLGGVPLHITSGYRCQVHNREIDGSRQSKHTLGMAADIKLPEGVDPVFFEESVKAIAEKFRGGCHYYADQSFAHLDVWALPPDRRW